MAKMLAAAMRWSGGKGPVKLVFVHDTADCSLLRRAIFGNQVVNCLQLRTSRRWGRMEVLGLGAAQALGAGDPEATMAWSKMTPGPQEGSCQVGGNVAIRNCKLNSPGAG